MSDSQPEELIRAEELLYNGRVEEALEIVTNFKSRNNLTPKDQLSALLLEGEIYSFTFEFKKAVEVGERAYLMSQELGVVPESIEALLQKAHIIYFGETDKALILILEAEKLLNSLSDESGTNISKLKLLFMATKAWIYNYKSDYNISLDVALEALTLAEKIKNNVIEGYFLSAISFVYWHKGEHDTALEYAMKCLKLYEEIDFKIGIAYGLFLMGQIYSLKGELNKALEFCEKSLSIEKISDMSKSNTLYVLGRIYREKGELDTALNYAKQAAKLAEKCSNYIIITVNNRSRGEIYMRKGENDKAIEYFRQSLALSEKIGYIPSMVPNLLDLLLVNLDRDTHEQAQQYLKRLENLSNQYEHTLVKHGYPLGKALMLKASSRMADHTDAARLLRQIAEDDILWPPFHILSIVSLCDLLLEELSMYNNPEIIDDINPLIMQLLNIAEYQHSYSYLVEAKLLQAKLALILTNLEETRKLLTEAQRIAELHDLQLLARKVSNEHDSLLEHSKTWNNLKEKNAPMVERIELASIDGIIDRLQGKRAIEPSELVHEQPTLLLIIGEGGSLLFSHKFVKNFQYEEDVISGFLTAFTTFSGELFSKGLDRAKFGEDTILMESVGQFSVCYLFKGQTYPAMQRLGQFIERIKNSIPIMQILEKFYKTSQILELKDDPLLQSLIDEIFIKKSIELNV
ncbi:MAG: tetratricopeptide repeat protein [Promethearchaeota archaeon]|jgi:tetratricopeptide (TPR) repeat protein